MKLVSLFNPVSLPDDPETAVDGDLYYNTTTGSYRIKLNGLWVSLIHDQNLKISIAPEIFVIGSPNSASTSVTLEQYHSENILNCVSASLTQVVIPNQGESSIHIGSRMGVVRGGTGDVQVVAADEEVSFSPPSEIYLTNTDTEVRLINIGYNQWIMTGEFPDLY